MEKITKVRFNIVTIICVIIFSFAMTTITLQNDTYYTIAIGEHIINNGIDMQDPFSFHELPYTYPHWLYDVGIYLIYSVGGMLGIYISTVILACILGLTIYITNKKIVKNELFSFLITLGEMYILSSYIAARAQLVTFILFALTVFFIEKFIETKKKRYAIALIIIPIIIANVHLAVWPFYFIIFLPYIGEYIISLLIDSHIVHKISKKIRNSNLKSLEKKVLKLQTNINTLQATQNTNSNKIEKISTNISKLQEKIAKLQETTKRKEEQFEEICKKQEERRKNPYKIKIVKKDAVKWLILILIICAFTGLLTPLGDTPYTYLLKTMQGNTTKSISEHLPMVLIESTYTLTILGIVLAILIFTDTKIRLKDLFMLGGLIILALMSRRQLSMLTLIGGYSVNRLVCDLFEKYDPKGTNDFIKKIASGFGIIITILLVILVSLVIYRPQIKKHFVNEKVYPVQAAEWIKENLNLDEIHLFNEYNYGSYLLYQGIPVFIDSRADLYTPEFNGDKDKNIFTDYVNSSGCAVYYGDIFDKYDITHVILSKNAKLNLFVSRDKNYNEIYKDDYFVVYEKLNDNEAE